jgi:hypothetical protein
MISVSTLHMSQSFQTPPINWHWNLIAVIKKVRPIALTSLVHKTAGCTEDSQRIPSPVIWSHSSTNLLLNNEFSSTLSVKFSFWKKESWKSTCPSLSLVCYSISFHSILLMEYPSNQSHSFSSILCITSASSVVRNCYLGLLTEQIL